MATKETTKKSTKGKKTTSKNVEKVEVKKETIKKDEEVKVQETKAQKKENKVLCALKRFFNNPAPLFIVLIAIILGLLLYINKNLNESKIYMASVSKGGVEVAEIHYFTNSDLNYFYAVPAKYSGEYKDKKIYNYEVGYYVVNNNKEYVPFLNRSAKLADPVQAATLIDEMSAWSIGELANSPKYFNNKVKPYIGNLHFVFKGSTDKDSNKGDVVIDVEVNVSKITKS